MGIFACSEFKNERKKLSFPLLGKARNLLNLSWLCPFPQRYKYKVQTNKRDELPNKILSQEQTWHPNSSVTNAGSKTCHLPTPGHRSGGRLVSGCGSAAPTSVRTARCSPNSPAASWEAEREPDLMPVSGRSQKAAGLYEYSSKLFREFLGDGLGLLPEY